MQKKSGGKIYGNPLRCKNYDVDSLSERLVCPYSDDFSLLLFSSLMTTNAPCRGVFGYMLL